ncbi:hypothetical protein FV141_09805 [Dermacoccus abyssi]|uniref:Uncharacterized protein n=1 Tax=Dermacoccus abyssi TaxID=322596 RepID=A0ABX5Z9Z9_9MICO|nr:hypothetical protein FV141_09805 [Dermacoccus abyssi]
MRPGPRSRRLPEPGRGCSRRSRRATARCRPARRGVARRARRARRTAPPKRRVVGRAPGCRRTQRCPRQRAPSGSRRSRRSRRSRPSSWCAAGAGVRRRPSRRHWDR